MIMMIVINRKTLSLALFALSLTFTAFSHETGLLEKMPSEIFQQEAQPETAPDTQKSKRDKRKKAQSRTADQPAEAVAPAPDSETQSAPAKPDKPRRQKPAKRLRKSAESAATLSPSPPVGPPTAPLPEPTVEALAQSSPAPAASATPSLTAFSTSAINPPGGNSILSLPVVLSLFALALIALIVTVLMLMKQLRGASKPEA